MRSRPLGEGCLVLVEACVGVDLAPLLVVRQVRCQDLPYRRLVLLPKALEADAQTRIVTSKGIEFRVGLQSDIGDDACEVGVAFDERQHSRKEAPARPSPCLR